jgi:hypothetical protein
MMDEVCFSMSLYNIDAIKKGIEAYQELASFSIDERANEAIVKINNIHSSLTSVLVDSFCNHVLNDSIILNRNKDGSEL